MDRFVWFVLLVVFSHLVTEFTRVTGYTRGPRHDSVMVNDSLIRPIKVQNLVQYPGQEYGQYAQRNPPYYSGNSHYNNYDNNGDGNGNSNSNSNNNANGNNNFLSNMFSGLFNQNSNNNNNVGNNNDFNNNVNGPEYPQINSHISGPEQSGIRTLGIVRPIIDSIFDIPISTLRAVNNLVGRLTGSYQVQQQQQHQHNNQLPPQQQQQQQQYFPSFLQLPSLPSFSLFPSAAVQPTFYGTQKSATTEPKTEIEMLKRLRQLSTSSSTTASNTNSNINSNNNSPQQQQLQRSNDASI